MPDKVHDDVLLQLAELRLDRDRPLLISDADEVIFAFVEGLERHLASNDLYLDLRTFALTGNIRRRSDDVAVDAGDVRQLIHDFFAVGTVDMPLIDDAVECLSALSREAEIVVLTNIPLEQRAKRAEALKNHGLEIPVVANIGRKGPAVAYLAETHKAPVVFMDDIPHNIDSVAEHAPGVHRLHFIGDSRLAKLLEPAEGSNARIDIWPDALAHIRTVFRNGHGD